MIQRIQSVYLLLVTVILSVCAFVSQGYFLTAEGAHYDFKPLGLILEDQAFSTWALFALLLFSAVIAFFTLFLYKFRPHQIRLCILNMLLILGYYGVLVFYTLKIKSDLGADYIIKWTVALPAIALILTYLALRGVGKDEALVRSYDRIR